MAKAAPHQFIVEPRRFAAVCGGVALAAGLAVLAAWATGHGDATSLRPEWPTMKANSALGAAALGLALLLASRGRQGPARIAAGAAALLGALTLVEYVAGASFGIDELLAQDTGSRVGSTSPGRMAVLTAADLVLVGLALLTWDRPGRAANGAVVLAGFFALFNLAFYFLGSIPPVEGTRMGAHTAALHLVLCAGVLLGRPGLLARTFLGRGLAAADARALLVSVVALPLTFGWAAQRLYEQGVLDVFQGASFALFANLCVLAVILVAVLLRLRREEERRSAAEATLTLNLRRIDDAERVTGRGSWEWDLAEDRPAWSDGMYRLFGVDRASFANSQENFLALVHPDDRKRVAQEMADARQRPGRFEQEYRLRRPGGAEVHVHGEGSVVAGPDGTPTHLYGVVQDVTRLRELESARLRAQERFARIFEASPVAIGLAREDGRLLDANAAHAQLTGYSREELVDPAFDVRSLYEDPKESDRILRGLQESGIVRAAEVGLRRKDGEVRRVLVSLEYIDLGGSTTVLSLLQDVTERHRTQKEREARIASEAELERLQRTEEFRTEFINSTAHELRTPMTALLMSLGALRHRVVDDEMAARSAATIQRAADRLNRVVADMVAAADLQARSIALDKRRLDLAPQLRAAVAAHADAAHRAGVRLEEPEDRGLAVLADERRLQLVLGHLLGNAVKFTPSGGAITVSSRRDGDSVRIEVADTGIGLTRAQIDRLWKPFAQEHDKAQRTDSGSGLGLYLTAGIVTLHGGEVGCSSPGPGQGSTFWFTLPAPAES